MVTAALSRRVVLGNCSSEARDRGCVAAEPMRWSRAYKGPFPSEGLDESLGSCLLSEGDTAGFVPPDPQPLAPKLEIPTEEDSSVVGEVASYGNSVAAEERDRALGS
jgi:hypothetical protein